ncbi:hypothetical protein [Nostoc sp. MG11]|uniref:hypothetical protein n=1 Tax=Nostoc sp. MG11 TaxID=2721166 RepID=UPI001D017CA6|nr:hypothetical protein [Nostoc sp. MG11]
MVGNNGTRHCYYLVQWSEDAIASSVEETQYYALSFLGHYSDFYHSPSMASTDISPKNK